jgi:glycosyltransferase involved in cell wall biosynthesis
VTRPRRILFVHELVGAFGGAERYLELLAPALRHRELQPSIALFGARTAPEAAERLRAAFVEAAVEPGTTTPWALRPVVRRLRPDLIHWNLFEPFIFRGGSITALPWGRPSVATDHLPMMRDGFHYEVVRRLINRRLAGMIVVSESAAEEARAHWRRLPPIAVVRNGVEFAERRIRTSPVDEPVRLLFVGRLEAQKRPLAAVAVLAAMRARQVPALLRLVGSGSEATAIERSAREQGVEDSVELLGFVDDPTPHLLDAHVLLAPGGFEGLPLAPIEALATGLPVLASDIPPHRELAQESAALRLVPADAGQEAWADEVERMLPQLSRLSEQATAVRESFSVDRMADETVAAYDSFLS